MPSQRKKGLKLLGAYVSDKQHADFSKKAKAREMDNATLLRELIEKFLEK